MADTYIKRPVSRIALTRGKLVSIIGQACWFEEEWKHIYRAVIPSKKLGREVAKAAYLISRGGEAICRKIMHEALSGLQALDYGDIKKAERALQASKRLIDVDVAASRIVGNLVGKLEVTHD